MKKTILIMILLMSVPGLPGFCEAPVFAKSRERKNAGVSGDTGRIEAVVRDVSGKLVEGARLYIYLNNNADFRGPANYVSDSADSSGLAGISLKPGKYYVIARKRVKEEDVGPLKEGDLSGRYDKNPVKLKGKDITKIAIIMEKIEGKMPLSPLSPNTSISIEGVLKDAKGNPVKNGYAMVYTSKDIFSRPDYMSRPSDDEGRFKVYISETGTFLLIGRIRYGGPPKLGELYGNYNEEGIEIKNNQEIKDIEIILKPFDIDLDTMSTIKE